MKHSYTIIPAADYPTNIAPAMWRIYDSFKSARHWAEQDAHYSRQPQMILRDDEPFYIVNIRAAFGVKSNFVFWQTSLTPLDRNF